MSGAPSDSRSSSAYARSPSNAFIAHLAAAGHKTHSFQITIKGEPGALTPDLYDATDHALYETKGRTTRANVRMATGQLADCRRHIPGRKELRVAVLLPSEPTEDVKDLLGEEYVELVYQTEDGGFAGWPLAYNQPWPTGVGHACRPASRW
ncbi:hypothetical protein [Streptomyces sp. NPDC088254]|uniref:hypothetical protein n=1 Tax=Streptomyces sp. NPDC088254 TaxID=3365847 RepID=UPI0037F9BEE4